MNNNSFHGARGTLRIDLDPHANGGGNSVPAFNKHLKNVTGTILISPDLDEPGKWPPSPPCQSHASPAGAAGSFHKLFNQIARQIHGSFAGFYPGQPHGLDFCLLQLNRARQQHPTDTLCTFLQRPEVVAALTGFCDLAATLHHDCKFAEPLQFPLDERSEYVLHPHRHGLNGRASGRVAFHTDATYKVVTGYTLVLDALDQRRGAASASVAGGGGAGLESAAMTALGDVESSSSSSSSASSHSA
jgi:hypothetical protein